MFNYFFNKEELAHKRNPFMDTFLDNETDTESNIEGEKFNSEDEEMEQI